MLGIQEQRETAVQKSRMDQKPSFLKVAKDVGHFFFHCGMTILQASVTVATQDEWVVNCLFMDSNGSKLKNYHCFFHGMANLQGFP